MASFAMSPVYPWPLLRLFQTWLAPNAVTTSDAHHNVDRSPMTAPRPHLRRGASGLAGCINSRPTSSSRYETGCCMAHSISTASSKGCSKVNPTRVRGAMGNAYFAARRADREDRRQAGGAGGTPQGAGIRRELASEPAADAKAQGDVARSLFAAGILLIETADSTQALAHFEEARDLLEGLPVSGPGSDGRGLLGTMYAGIGVMLGRTGKLAEATAALQRSVDVLTRLADDNPAVTEFRSHLVNTHNIIGNLQSGTGKPVEALDSYRAALAIGQKLADDNPAFSEFRNQLADSHTNIGWLLVQNGRAAEAVAECSRAEAIQTRLVQENPSVPDYRNRLAACQTNSATALLRLGRTAEAPPVRAGGAAEEALVKGDPETADYRVRLGESLLRRGLARRDEGDAAGAAADWRRADALLDGAGALAPDFTFIQACCHSSLSWAAGRPDSGVSAGEADAEAAKALALLRRAAEMGFRNLATYLNETALDPLRSRPDFRLMMTDLAMPTEPFAQ